MKLHFLLFGVLTLAGVLSFREASRGNGSPPEAPPANKTPTVSFKKDVLPFLTKHCYHCHGNGKKRAGLALDKYTDDESLQKDRKVWTFSQTLRSF